MQHDFIKVKEEFRYDSKGQACTKVGGVMDYWMNNENDASTWSTCSHEDMTALFKKYPGCMAVADSTNIPQTNPPPLTTLECKTPSSMSDIRGVHYLKLNGK